MLPDDLRDKALRAASQLEKQSGVWPRNIAARLREVAEGQSSNTAAFARRHISLADYNHLQSRVNYLTALADGWKASTEPYAGAILDDLNTQLADTRSQQAAIIALIQYSWISDQ